MSDALTRFALAAGGFGLTWLAQSTALLILGLLAGRAARRRGPALQSAVYRTTLAAVLLCPLASNLLSAMGVEGLAIRLPQPAEEPPQQSLADLLRSDVNEEVFTPAPAPAMPPSNEPPPNIVIEPIRYKIPEALAAKLEQINVPTKLAPVESPSQSNPFLIAPTAGVALWAIGALFLLARMLVQQARMSRVRAKAVAVEPGVQAACATIAGRLGVKPPPVRMSPFLSSPCLDGLFRPMILLPEEMDDDPRDALVHELAHLARRDGWWNLARRLATAALWFQPLAWVLSRRVETTAEEVCDDVAVDLGADRTRYAELLVTIAGRSLPPSSPAAVHMIGRRSPLRRRITRILDASRPLSTRAGRLAILAVLLIGAASTAFAGLLTIGRAPNPEPPPAIAEEPAPKQVAEPALTEEDPTIHGRVIDDQGKPVAGATVVAWRWRRGPVLGVGLQEYLPNRRFDSRSATTDADGRYSMPDFDPAPDWDDQARYTRIYAAAPEYVAGAKVWRGSNRGPSFGGDVRLSKSDQPIVGRVLDPQGRPVSGARVKLRQAYLPQPEAPPADAFPAIAGGRRRHDGGPIQEALGLGDLTTDADGRFRFSGLGYDSFAIFEILRPDLAPHLVRVVAKPMQPHQRRDIDLEAALHEMSDFLLKEDEKPLHASEIWAELRSQRSETTLYGSDFTTTLEPSWSIEGSIRDADSREPIAGVVVAASRDQHDGRGTPARITATTDAQGRYRIIAPPAYDGTGPWISTHPLVDQPYFVSGPTKAKGPSGPTTWDFDLRRGRWIVGKLIDEDQRRPVAAVVDYAPAKDNPLVAAYFGQPPGLNVRNGLHRDRFQTAADGTFRVLGIPGAGFVLARTEDPSYLSSYGVGWTPSSVLDPFPESLPTAFHTDPAAFQAARSVDVPAGDTPVACDLSVSRGGSVLLKFVDAKGESLKATVVGRVPPPPSWTGLHPTLNEPAAEVRVERLAPGESRRVAISGSYGFGAIIDVQAGPDRVVTLHPRVLVTGRIVHGDGRPARGIVDMAVRDSERHPAAFSPYSTSDDIDETGAFHCWADVGGPYVLYAMNLTYQRPNGSRGASSKKAPGGFDGFPLAKGLTIEPGKPVDLGTFNADNGQRIEDPKPAPQPVPAPAGAASINGRVLDEQGKPIPGATVVAWRWRRGKAAGVGLREFLPDRRFDSRTATTDADGRYSMPDFEPAPEWDDQARWTLLRAAAPGYVLGAAIWKSPFTDDKVGGDVQLAKGDHPIEGRVVDLEGRPVAGARVRLRQMRPPFPAEAAGDLSVKFGLRAGSIGGPFQKALGLDGLTTDAEGRFRIPGLRRDSSAVIEIDRPDLAPKLFHVLASSTEAQKARGLPAEVVLELMLDLHPGPGVEVRGPGYSYLGTQSVFYGSEFTATMEPARIVEGVVRDADTKQPIAGIAVAASRDFNVDGGREVSGRFTTITDAEGRYRISTPAATDREAPWISVHPRADQPYFTIGSPRIDYTPGTPVKRNFELKRGQWIVGKLTEVNGRPVPAEVDYAPMAANRLVYDYLGLQPGSRRFQDGYHDGRFQTAADGTFRVLGIPGPGVVLVRAHGPYPWGVGGGTIPHNPTSPRLLATAFWTNPNAFHVVKAVDVPGGDASFTCDLSVDPGSSVLLKFVDEKGAPVAAMVSGEAPHRPYWENGNPYPSGTLATEVRIAGLTEKEARPVWIHTESGPSLAAALVVTPGPDRTVTLHPKGSVSGRYLRGNGDRAEGGVELHLGRNGRNAEAPFPFLLDNLNAQGKFEFAAPVGGPYILRAKNFDPKSPKAGDPSSMKADDGTELARDLWVEPGKPLDLGAFNADMGKPAEKKD